jgi:tetratricopeptide (TPR) repeat protein
MALRAQEKVESPAAQDLGRAEKAIADKDYAAALEQLKLLAAKKDRETYPAVLFCQGLAQRGQGLRAQAQAKSAESGRIAAQKCFTEAAGHFAAAAGTYAARVKAPPPSDGPFPADFEWAACARCAQAEMLLRLGRAKEAQSAMAGFLKDSSLQRSRYRDQALYYQGLASLILGDHLAGGRSLNLISSFADPVFGSHARYLLGRTHHLLDERAEALGHYEAVLSDYEARKKQAAEALAQPEKLQDNPAELARLQTLVKEPPPDDIVGAAYHAAFLLYEAGRFSDAQARFAEVAAQPAGANFRIEARLLGAMCAVRLEQYGEAIKVLQQIAGKEPTLAGPALLWLGKAQAASADPEDGEKFHAALLQAERTLRRALTNFQPLPANDARGVVLARSRRGEILLELADIHHRASQHKDAAALFSEVMKDDLLPERASEVLQRRLTALNLAGIYGESHKACVDFQQAYPKSVLLPEVLFRRAESAYFLGLSAEPNANVPGAGQEAARRELARLVDEAVRHYQLVAEKFPESAQASPARFGLALTYYRKGDLEKVVAGLERIPPPDRNGDLIEVPYVEADCLIRLAPVRGDDALTAGRMQEQLGKAVELLASFAADHPDYPRAPDALLRVGMCQQRLADLLSKDDERKSAYSAARATCEKLLVEHPLNELGPLAVVERARCLALAGDANEACNRLRAFAAEPLKKQPIAPLALVQLATLLRAQENKAGEAAQVLARCRQQHEKVMLKDPAQSAWVPLVQFHQGVALHEAGRHAEARAVFDALIQQHPLHPLAVEASLRRGQTIGAEAWQRIEKAQQTLGTPEIKPDVAAAANQGIEEAWKAIAENLQNMESQAEQLRQNQPASNVRARLLYETAWGRRAFIDREVEAARTKLQEELQKKLQEAAAKNTPEGQPVPNVPAPDVPLEKIALQPAEKKARATYQALIASFADEPLAWSARLELGELHMDRGDPAAAQKLFNEALDKEPPAPLTSKLRVRLGTLLAGRGDFKGALPHFNAISGNADDPLAGQAHLRAAECLIRLGDLNAASARLSLFRDNEKFQNVANVSDVALLRLGHVLAQLKRWDESRQAHEQLPARFGGSPWVREALYGIGWARHKQGQYDEAVGAYQQALADQTNETAARSQLMIGVCQVMRKQYAEAVPSLQAVVDKYGIPELSALALIEAAHAQGMVKQRAEADKLLQRVATEYAGTPWAEVAKQRRKTPANMAPHDLPAAVRLLTPSLQQFPALESLGQYQDDRVPLDDPSRDIVWALIMSRQPGQRQAPFALQRLTVPDPFEYHKPIRQQTSLAEERVRAGEQRRLP